VAVCGAYVPAVVRHYVPPPRKLPAARAIEEVVEVVVPRSHQKQQLGRYLSARLDEDLNHLRALFPRMVFRTFLRRKTGFPESSVAVITAFDLNVPWTGNRSDCPFAKCATALACRLKFFVPVNERMVEPSDAVTCAFISRPPT
jgi:hypothetical protein